MKLDAVLKQYDLGLGFSLSISQFSIFNIGSILGQSLTSCTQYWCKLLLTSRFKPRANFSSRSRMDHCDQGIGYTDDLDQGHMFHPWGMGVEISLFCPSPASMEDQSPQNKIRVWSVELMFSTNTQGPGAQIILSSIIPHLSRNSGYLLKTESKSYQLKRKKENV